MLRPRRIVACLAAVASLAATACSGGPEDPDALVLYNAQHADLMKVMTDAFTAKTGIPVQVRKGGDYELANAIAKEGGDSPADVFVTENSPAMALVDRRGLFAPLPQAVVDAVPAEHTAANKTWAGFAGRSTAFVYDPDKLGPATFPTSLMDLVKPEWKGRFGFAPAGADFQAIVAAVYALKGEEQGDAFVKGLKENGRVYASNFAVMQAVNADQVEAGVIYHYYWYKDRAASGANSRGAELHFFGKQDPGAFLSISGVGVLKGSNKKAEAEQLASFLVSPEGQQALNQSGALEYAIAKGAQPDPRLKPIAELQPPTVAIASLNGGKVVEELRAVGIL